MDLIDVGTNAGAGLLGVVLTFLGFKGRLDRLEKVVDGSPLKFVGTQTHNLCVGATVARLDKIENRLGKLEEHNVEQTGLLYEIKGSLEARDE